MHGPGLHPQNTKKLAAGRDPDPGMARWGWSLGFVQYCGSGILFIVEIGLDR